MRKLFGLAVAMLITACGGGSDPSIESAQKSARLAVAQPSAIAGTTYYIRTDGGSAAQCDGKANAPYPGSGALQKCAWQSPHDALPTNDKPRIAGGDTLIIGAGEYQVGWGAPGAAGGRCDAGWKYDCQLAALPSGPSPEQPTRVLGQGFDGTCSTPPKLWGNERVPTVLNLADSSNVEVACLDITDKSICVGNHASASLRCVRGDAVTYGAYADAGIRAYRSTNVKLRDLTIHGLAYHGIQAGAISHWTLERVRLLRNGYAGWDGDLSGVPGVATSSNSGALTFRHVEIAWNGCAENPATGEATGCYAQKNGGYGDGLGAALTGGQWLFEDVAIHHNTSDGLDMLYLDGKADTRITLNRVHAYSNAGNQVKVNGNATVRNSVIVGDCGSFYRDAPKYPYLGSGDHCRAGGTALSLALQTASQVDVTHNTITGEGDILIFHGAKTDRAGTPLDDTGAKVLLRNNILLGQTDFTGSDGELVAAHYWEKTRASTSYAGNVFFNVKSQQCPTGSLCTNPLLTVSAMRGFDPRLQPGSSALDKVAAIADIPTDFFNKQRVVGAAADIGAVETQSGADTPTCTRAQPTLDLRQPTAPIAAGTSATFTLALKNNDPAACGISSFGVNHTPPQGWTGQWSASTLTLAPGAQATTQLTLHSPASASGIYSVPVRSTSVQGAVHEVNATGVVQVHPTDNTGGALTGGVVTDKVRYRPGQTVKIGAAVKRDGRPQSGATVDFTIEGPNDIRWTGSSQTDGNGMAWSSYQLGAGSAARGHYYIYATASYPGATGYVRERNRFDVR